MHASVQVRIRSHSHSKDDYPKRTEVGRCETRAAAEMVLTDSPTDTKEERAWLNGAGPSKRSSPTSTAHAAKST
eukprot:3701217-Alexandrium_andersonii.AAC.1